MKRKNGTLYTLIIMFFFLALLTWFFPITTYQSEFVNQGNLKVGIMELFTYPTYTFYNFIYVFMFLLLVGGLYGILKNIKAYRVLVDKVAAIVKRKEAFYTAVTIIVLSVVVSFTGLTYELLSIMPFIATIALLNKRDKVTAVLLTLGPIVVGAIGNTFSSPIAGVFVQGLQIEFKELIITKIILLLLSCVVLMVTVFLHNRKVEGKEMDQEFYFIPEKVDSKEKVRVWPLVLILGIFAFVKLIGTIGWKSTFGLNFFADLKSKIDAYPLFSKLIMFLVFGLTIIIMLIKYIIKKRKDKNITLRKTVGTFGVIVFIFSIVILCLTTVKVFLEDAFKVTTVFTKVYDAIGFKGITLQNLFGETAALGEWSYSECIVWLFVLNLVLMIGYKVKPHDAIDNMGSGMKYVLYASIVCMFAYTILVLTSNNPVMLSILKPLINLTSKTTIAPVLRIFIYTFVTLISSFMNCDFSYITYGVFNLSFAVNNFTGTSLLPIVGLIHQGSMGVALLIAPTSIPMLFILNTLNLSYKEWLKRTWLLFVLLLYLLLVASIIALLVN
ncbi:MAG: hypothetical protein J6X02_01335 [Bacilli bacterium]|nr:hypothetical protein [Bacilli bacterium]